MKRRQRRASGGPKLEMATFVVQCWKATVGSSSCSKRASKSTSEEWETPRLLVASPSLRRIVALSLRSLILHITLPLSLSRSAENPPHPRSIPQPPHAPARHQSPKVSSPHLFIAEPSLRSGQPRAHLPKLLPQTLHKLSSIQGHE
ncbi:hypothetical protein BCR35DRAFT_203935 [Leucosporidium creatinivorum]|uniref:Uncharacterized protein n=1 Tax=Leucosporidium creatinivorum TaxID=106004 RepID=A0A1Y2FZR1_9BASI|nr:hypothetical protein BCR35DRAFT_203935 [Leucosporidium creatinivorum]